MAVRVSGRKLSAPGFSGQGTMATTGRQASETDFGRPHNRRKNVQYGESSSGRFVESPSVLSNAMQWLLAWPGTHSSLTNKHAMECSKLHTMYAPD